MNDEAAQQREEFETLSGPDRLFITMALDLTRYGHRAMAHWSKTLDFSMLSSCQDMLSGAVSVAEREKSHPVLSFDAALLTPLYAAAQFCHQYERLHRYHAFSFLFERLFPDSHVPLIPAAYVASRYSPGFPQPAEADLLDAWRENEEGRCAGRRAYIPSALPQSE